jgi:hypothetical protein
MTDADPAPPVMTEADPAPQATDENPSGPTEPVLADGTTDSIHTGVESSAPAESIPTAMVTEEDVKAGWMRSRDALYGLTSAELENRRLFEELIKRSYFHVKPLDAAQVRHLHPVHKE